MSLATPSSEASRTRLLILMSDLGGGTGNHVLRMADRWDPDEWQPALASTEPRTSRFEPSLPVIRLPEPRGPGVYPVRQLMRFRQIRRLVQRRRPRLLHAYFFWPILYGRMLRLSGAVPRLVENREDQGFNWGRHEYAWLRLTRSVPDRVICVSEAVRDVALEREGLDPARTAVIHNGIEPQEEVSRDVELALRDELGIPEEAPVVGMVANLNRRVKGVDRFLEIAPLILERVPDARFVIVGLGGDEEALRTRVERRGVADRVILPGYRDDIEVFYAMMSVSVLTSRSEGLSITLLESMAHGLPVVATDVGGNPELVEEGRTGFLVPLHDRREFADRVAELLEDPGLRERMGSAGRRRALESFDLDRTARRYSELYREVLEHPTGSRGRC